MDNGTNEKESSSLSPANIQVPLGDFSELEEEITVQEIWKELSLIVHRLRFFQDNCIGWKKEGGPDDSENIFLDLTITELEDLIEKGRRVTNP
jgi:hypothetical protein